MRRLAVTLATATLCALSAAPAFAEPPPNDSYLLSTRVDDDGSWPTGWPIDDAVDTTEATVQGDLFAPPHAGGGPEPTRCGDVSFGKTVWYDVRTTTPGVVAVRAAGYDTVVAAYRYEPRTTALGPAIECRRAAELLLPVAPGRSYAVQIGGADAGAGAAFGLLTATFELEPERRVQAAPTLRGTRTRAGYRVRSLVVAGVTRGDRVEARCIRGCSLHQVRTAPSTGELGLPRFRGSTLRPGARIEVRVTRDAAVGTWTRFLIRRRGAPKRTDGII